MEQHRHNSSQIQSFSCMEDQKKKKKWMLWKGKRKKKSEKLSKDSILFVSNFFSPQIPTNWFCFPPLANITVHLCNSYQDVLGAAEQIAKIILEQFRENWALTSLKLCFNFFGETENCWKSRAGNPKQDHLHCFQNLLERFQKSFKIWKCILRIK